MKNKIPLFIGVLIIVSVFSLHIRGQEKIIKGTITTFDSIPLMNASVKVKSTKQVTFTDSLGHFSVPCNVGDKLQFTAKGFNSYNVTVNDKTKFIFVNLQLKPGPKNLEYAIGYGHVSEKDKLYAISSLKNGDVDFSTYNDMYELIKGRLPGVTVENGEIRIRGQRSINSSNAALIVVDGIIVDNSYLSLIPPTTVASIDILKDASSSIYGSRGANGVVIIETKHGGNGYKKK